ncbi:MAG: hypothetical protein ACOC2M_02905 [bacterium]
MDKYKVERSNITYNNYKKSMICTFTITNNETQEQHVFKNIYLAEDNKDAFLIFPSTNEEVYINRENHFNNKSEKSTHIFTQLVEYNN